MDNNPLVDKANLSDTERELLTELIESPVWGVIVNKVAYPYVEQHISQVLGLARGGSVPAYAAGKVDGVGDFLSQLCLTCNTPIPTAIKKLTRRA